MLHDEKTPEAARLINDVAKKHESWRANADHVQALSANPATRPLADILKRREIAAITTDYKKHSDAAVRYQTRHQNAANRSVFCSAFAAVIAGVMLYAGVGPTDGAPGISLAAAYFLLIITALFGSVYISVGKPWDEWKANRSKAENLRLRYFRDILKAVEPSAAQGAQPTVAALKLEFVRAFLMDDQRDWYGRRAKDFKAKVLRTKLIRIFALVLVVVASLPVLIALLTVPPIAQVVPADVTSFAAELVAVGKQLDGKLLALVGVIGAAIQTLVTGLAASSLADRNAVVYADMQHALKKMGEEDLTAARQFAADGNMNGVSAFWTKLSGMLIAEHGGWADALRTAQLLTLDQFSPVSSSSD